jgi:AraC-like DNA-binding protein
VIANDLADISVADARSKASIIADLEQITGFTSATIERRLAEAHGRTLLSNCFADRWPEPPGPDELADLNVADARNGHLVAALAAITGMSPAGVARRLNGAHGHTLLRTCFSDRWPDDTRELLDADELQHLTVAEASQDDLAVDIAEVTGMSLAGVRRRLNARHGRTLLTTCFEDCWPHEDLEVEEEEIEIEELAGLRVADALAMGLAEAIAEVTGMSVAGVSRRLNAAHGATLVTNCFSDRWPIDEVDDGDVGPLNAEELSALTVKEAIEQLREKDIATVTGMSPQGVTRRLNEAHGRTLLRTCFYDRWPDTLEMLAVLNAADARERGLASTLSRLLGVSEALASRRIHDAHGRTLLPHCFEREWPWDEVPARRSRRKRRQHVKPEVAQGSQPEPPRKKITGNNDRVGEAPAISDHDRVDKQSASVEPSHRPVRGRKASTNWDSLRVVNDRWELVKRLGSGGFGTVFEALDLETSGPNVVIKFPRPDDPKTIQALKREYEVTRHLKHPNICAYWHYAHDEQFRIPFVVMEFGGESIEEIMEVRGAFSPEAAVTVICDAADALEHVHARDQIHGDVNPGNLLIHNGKAMLVDFGVASNIELQRQADGAYTKIATSLHGYHRVYGAQDDPTTRKSDQFSLALVLCTMLEGRVFEGRYHFAGFPALSPAQNDAIRRALAERPADRFPSCRAFAQALRDGLRS